MGVAPTAPLMVAINRGEEQQRGTSHREPNTSLAVRLGASLEGDPSQAGNAGVLAEAPIGSSVAS